MIAPRSYHVSIPTRVIRRNQSHLRRMPNVSDSATTESDGEVQSDVARPQLSNTDGRVTVTRSGRVSKPPTR